MIRGSGRVCFRAIVFKNRVANCHALIADVSPRIVTGRGNELSDCILGFVAERTTKCFFRRSGLHIELLDKPEIAAGQRRGSIPT